MLVSDLVKEFLFDRMDRIAKPAEKSIVCNRKHSHENVIP